ncbi:MULTISPECIES: hypothetical protein [Halorubrum]|uniref:hypothetical protein n=1 Tax=Halorubrum TaxID=56688 RepID=UPI000F858506|nr:MULTISPECIES: hypothetical protein [Halorubrum]AZQ13920.1 hypothetical protein DOS48_03260 [Halorubrum sp. PV6]
MNGESAAHAGGDPHPAVVVGGVFATIVTLTLVAYAVAVNTINLLAVDVLAYPVGAVAPFVVITGAILTIPIVIPTALVSLKRLG